jgi:hypothetical protein
MGSVFSASAPQGAAAPSDALDWRQVLECAGRAQRRRRFGFPARDGVKAGFRRCACAKSKAAWRFASRRTPKMGAACSRSWHHSAPGWGVALNRYRMGEGESPSIGRHIQPLWKLRETGLAVPAPVGRERVTCLPRRSRRRQGVRVVLFEIRLLSGTCFCTNPKSWCVSPQSPGEVDFLRIRLPSLLQSCEPMNCDCGLLLKAIEFPGR